MKYIAVWGIGHMCLKSSTIKRQLWKKFQIVPALLLNDCLGSLLRFGDWSGQWRQVRSTSQVGETQTKYMIGKLTRLVNKQTKKPNPYRQWNYPRG